MRRYKPESSIIDEVSYDPTTARLEIIFKSDLASVYRYRNVTPAMVGQLLFAESAGTYFAKAIKSDPAAFPYQKLTRQQQNISKADRKRGKGDE